MIARLYLITLFAGALMLLASCGRSGTSAEPLADGGISGTGEGTVTGYGSIIINGDRHFQIAAGTNLSLDDQPITELELSGRGNGFVARVDVGDDVSPDFTSGTAVNVILEHLVKGPVTSVAPLEVLGQPVFTTGDTVLVNLAAVGDLVVGDRVEVSGLAGTGNVIEATRLERKASLPVWKLVGPVSGLVGNTLNIGTQPVDFTGVTPRDCAGGLANGDRVAIKATEIPGFAPGNTVDTVTDLECRAPGLQVPPGTTANVLRAEIEGFVDDVSAFPPSFSVSGQAVLTTVGTAYEGGAEVDVALGVKLEAEGSLNVATGVLTAAKVRFRQTRVRMEGPATTVTPGESVVVMGLTVHATPFTEDADNVLGGSGGIQVRARGFVDGSGQIFADRLELRNLTPSNSGVRLRGPVSGIPGEPVFAILGITIDTTGTLTFLDQAGNSLTSGQFFGNIAVGTPVDAETGTFDGVDTINDPSKVTIED